VPVYGVGEQDGLHYYDMQFIHGLGLDQVLDELRRLRQGRNGTTAADPPAATERAPAAQIAEALLTGQFALAPDAAPLASLAVAPSVSDSSTAVHLPGQDEHSTLSESGRGYWQGVARIGVQVAEALAHAHGQGILHRDIKPSNLLLDTRGTVWVTDFGLAKEADGDGLTRTGDVVGTLRYMAPERFGGQSDPRSDLYGLGVTLYELLTLRPAFDEADRLRLVERIGRQDPPRPRALNPRVPRDLETVVLKAIAKEPARRYPTAQELADDLRRFLEDRSIRARRALPWERIWRWCRRNPAVAMMTLALVLALTVLAGGVGWVGRDRAAREAKAVNDLAMALESAELFQAEGKQADARAALERAEGLAREAPPDPAQGARLVAVKERLDAEARDRLFLDQFEEIRLRVESRFDVENNLLRNLSGFPDIREALQCYGITIDVTPPAQAAACVQGRPEEVRRNLIAALDECFRCATNRDKPARPWLLATLAAADSDAWRTRARKALLDGDLKGLEQLARDADAGKHPANFLLSVAHSLPARMRPGRLELLRRTQRAYPADLWANYWLAAELSSSGQPAEAVRYYTAALALRPENPLIYLGRGNALFDAREVDAAIADYRQSCTLAPRYAVGRNNLGHALRIRGRLDEAIAELREAIRLKPDLANPHYHLGHALKAKGRLEEAIAEFQQAIRLKPDYAKAHLGLGRALHDLGRIPDAILPPAENEVRRWLAHPRGEGVWGMALSPDGRRALSCGDDRAVRLWEVATGRELWRWDHQVAGPGRWDRLRRVACSPDGSRVLVAAYDHTVRLLDAATGKELRRFEGHKAYVHSASFSSDGRLALSASGTWVSTAEQDNTVRLWDAATGKELRRFEGHTDTVHTAVFSPDDRFVLSAMGDRTLRLWDARTGQEVRRFTGHESGIQSAVFSADGRRALSGSCDHTLRLWDVDTGRELRRFQGHTDCVESVAFSADGRRALSAGKDGPVRLWDVDTGKELLQLKGHAGPVHAAVFSPDGQHILSGGFDGTMRLWRIPESARSAK
jgi:WD40 repeat protein/tetratricopeptide (TPR) repeat protein